MPPPKPKPKAVAGINVKLVRLPSGYKVVTQFLGMIVGSRLDRCKGIRPQCATEKIKSLGEAVAALKEWDKFIELQKKK